MARTVQEIQESQRILAEKQAQLKAAIASPDLGIRFEGQVARLQGQAALAELESQAAALNLELNNATNAPVISNSNEPFLLEQIVVPPQNEGPNRVVASVEITESGDVITPPIVQPISEESTVSANLTTNPYSGAGAAPVVQPSPQQQVSTAGDGAAVVNPQVPIVQSAMNQVESPLLTPAESIARAQKKPEDVDPAVAAANFNSATNQSILSAITPANNTTANQYPSGIFASVTGATAPPSTVNLPPEIKFSKAEDWRVRLSLAPGSKYLYNGEDPGILEPLINTNGVIFPYTPTIQMGYKANYDTPEITHSNYKLHFYKNSSVEDVSITAEFTAQDTVEANYLLAVLHFFKSATKMFYGQDKEPKPGTPPPLLYLSGFGTYQYDNHPLLLSSFSYTLPNEVDYIRAGVSETWAGSSISTLTGSTSAKAATNPLTAIINKVFRIKSNGLQPGGQKPVPTFKSLSNQQATYVPSKLQITLTLMPVVTRRDISQNFSLQKYATGELLQGSKRQGGGIW